MENAWPLLGWYHKELTWVVGESDLGANHLGDSCNSPKLCTGPESMMGSGQTGDEIGKQCLLASNVDWKGSRGKMGREKGRCFVPEVGITAGEPGEMEQAQEIKLLLVNYHYFGLSSL